ncbi:MAG: cytidine deaminase [Clostridia bacterium]|nr:cytidine deaminase [Clostridia bacterium]
MQDVGPVYTLSGKLLKRVEKALVQAAADAREKAYTPYSHFKVGAALLTKSGKIYTGCNIENASYTPTVCAERTAVFKAVSEGDTDFAAIAVVGGPEGPAADFCAPCGVCRQVLAEFCPAHFPVLLGKPGAYSVHPLSDLLPFAFTPKDLL